MAHIPVLLLLLILRLVPWALTYDDIPSYITDHGVIFLHNRNDRSRQYTGHIQLTLNYTIVDVCSVVCKYNKIHQYFPDWKEAVDRATISIPITFNSTLGKNYVRNDTLLLSKLISNF